MSEIHDILARFLDDRESLSEAQYAALARAAGQSPQVAAELKEQLVLDELLGQGLAIDRRDFAAQVDQRLRDDEGLPPVGSESEAELLRGVADLRTQIAEEWMQGCTTPKARKVPYPWLIVAASLLAALGLGVWYLVGRPQAPGSTAAGGAAGERQPEAGPTLDIQTVLDRGGRLETAWGEAAGVRYDDGTVVRAQGGTALRFIADTATGAKRTVVEHGLVEAQVAPQPPKKPMVFDTPPAEAVVRGTHLSLFVRGDAARLEVQSGRVEFLRRADRASVSVEAGQYAWVSPQGLVVCQAMVYPGTTWAQKTPAGAGLDAIGLRALAVELGGNGCVVRHGSMVFTWGDPARTESLAEASEPILSHLLLRALEEKKIPGLGARVAQWEPALDWLNESLQYKDRSITWGYLANHVAGYGTADTPGAAFGTPALQSALLADALFDRVYEVPRERWDRDIVCPHFAEPLSCEDRPRSDRVPGTLAVSARDLARFGLLYARLGQWNGKAILRPESVAVATGSPLGNSIPLTGGATAEILSDLHSGIDWGSPCDHFGSYSFGWWTNGVDRSGQPLWPDAPRDAYAALGRGGGETLLVIPSLDLIAAWTGASSGSWTSGPESPTNRAIKRLLGCLTPQRP